MNREIYKETIISIPIKISRGRETCVDLTNKWKIKTAFGRTKAIIRVAYG